MKKLWNIIESHWRDFTIVLVFLIMLSVAGYKIYADENLIHFQKESLSNQKIADRASLDKLNQSETEVAYLKGQDQYKINQNLKNEISSISATYKQAVKDYESLLDLKLKTNQTDNMDKSLALVLSDLGEGKYSQAQAALTDLETQIKIQNDKLAASSAAPINVPTNNNPPGSGFSVQKVHTDQGDFVVDIIAADLSSTKVIIDTASNSDCSNNCPVLPLSTYISRNGAYAGINGAFFCPASYPSCAGKTNSFDTLLMNKNKYYFNSDNNVYSTVPAVIFSGSSVRFVSQSLQWGRDTSVDGVIANYPLLVQNSQIVYTGSANEPKFYGNGPRCFVANKGGTVYIGIVQNATMINSADVLHAMGMENALNLDEGGSTALWYGGKYIAGPGRDLPDALVFVKK